MQQIRKGQRLHSRQASSQWPRAGERFVHHLPTINHHSPHGESSTRSHDFLLLYTLRAGPIFYGSGLRFGAAKDARAVLCKATNFDGISYPRRFRPVEERNRQVIIDGLHSLTCFSIRPQIHRTHCHHHPVSSAGSSCPFVQSNGHARVAAFLDKKNSDFSSKSL